MYLLIRTQKELQQAIHDLSQYSALAYDIESTGVDARHDVTLIIAIGTRDVQYAIDVRAIGETLVYASLKTLLETKHLLIHNAVFDVGFMFQHKIYPTSIHCTMITEQILTAGKSFLVGADLASVAERYLGIEMSKDVRKEFIDAHDITLEEKHFAYAAKDVTYLFDIADKQLEKIALHDLQRIYDLEMALIPATVSMEQTGILVNRPELEQLIPYLTRLSKTADKAIQDLFIANGAANHIQFSKDGYIAVNLNSKQQVLQALALVGVNPVTKEGKPSLNAKDVLRWDMKHTRNVDLDEYDITGDDDIDEAIKAYEGLNNVYLRAIAYVTAIRKLLSAYVIGTLEKINPDTGRCHFWFRQVGAKATGRFSSNGQQIPNDRKLKRLSVPYTIRGTLIASPGRKLLIADYSAIELVILADRSGDERLGHEVIHGDVHIVVCHDALSSLVSTAREVTKDNKDKLPYKYLREAAKRVSYATAYGITGIALSEQLTIDLSALNVKVTRDQADTILHNWKTVAFPQAGDFLRQSSEMAVNKGFTRSALGRKRWYDLDYAAQEKWALFKIMREGSNHPIQSSSADMTKLAMLNIWRNLDFNRARMVLCVHDEIVIETTDRYAETAAKIMADGMNSAARTVLPIMGQYVNVKVSTSDRYDK